MIKQLPNLLFQLKTYDLFKEKYKVDRKVHIVLKIEQKYFHENYKIEDIIKLKELGLKR